MALNPKFTLPKNLYGKIWKDQNWYWEYLNTSHWQNIRRWAFKKAKGRCQKCNRTATKRNKLHVHHRHYRTLWNEGPDDLMVLCDACHCKAHGLAANDPQYEMDFGSSI